MQAVQFRVKKNISGLGLFFNALCCVLSIPMIYLALMLVFEVKSFEGFLCSISMIGGLFQESYLILCSCNQKIEINFGDWMNFELLSNFVSLWWIPLSSECFKLCILLLFAVVVSL